MITTAATPATVHPRAGRRTSEGVAVSACAAVAAAVAVAIPPDPDSCGEAPDPLATFTRPELVSRFRRFKSARISAALWYRSSRSFSRALQVTCSNSIGRLLFSRTGATGFLVENTVENG